MDLITALAVSIGVLGGIAAFVLLSPFGMGMQIWVAFIAWATFYHCGGKEAGLTKALTRQYIRRHHGLDRAALGHPGPARRRPWRSAMGRDMRPDHSFHYRVRRQGADAERHSGKRARIRGFAGLALTGNKLGAVTSASLENPFVVGVISLIIGAVLGYISQKIALAMAEE